MITQAIIILGAPRAGTTILQRCLALHPDLWHLPSESHAILEGPFHPESEEYRSNHVSGEDLGEKLVHELRAKFYQAAINLNAVLPDPSLFFAGTSLPRRVCNRIAVSVFGYASRWQKKGCIRFLEKTPKNTLRIPMLERLFPSALYVWITRKAATNIDSLIAGWFAEDRIGPFARKRFAGAGYPIADQLNLLDYRGEWWKFALVPDWRSLKGRTVADVAAWQYYQCNRIALSDLKEIDARRVFPVQYEELVGRPAVVVAEILEWADLPPSDVTERFARVWPRVNQVVRSGGAGTGQGLRYPEAVRAAMARLPGLGPLQTSMGYDTD